MKRPLESVLSVYSNSEDAIAKTVARDPDRQNALPARSIQSPKRTMPRDGKHACARPFFLPGATPTFPWFSQPLRQTGGGFPRRAPGRLGAIAARAPDGTQSNAAPVRARARVRAKRAGKAIGRSSIDRPDSRDRRFARCSLSSCLSLAAARERLRAALCTGRLQSPAGETGLHASLPERARSLRGQTLPRRWMEISLS